MRWSLFLTFTWLSLLVTWRLISVIPYYVTSFIIVLFKSCNENVRTALEYIVVLRGWTCFALCMIWMFIFYQIVRFIYQNLDFLIKNVRCFLKCISKMNPILYIHLCIQSQAHG